MSWQHDKNILVFRPKTRLKRLLVFTFHIIEMSNAKHKLDLESALGGDTDKAENI